MQKNSVQSLVRGYSNSISANPTKWSNSFKQLVGNLPTNCLIVFNHFVKLALKELKSKQKWKGGAWECPYECLYSKDINSRRKFSLLTKSLSYPGKNCVGYYTSLRRIKVVDSFDFTVVYIFFYTVVNI